MRSPLFILHHVRLTIFISIFFSGRIADKTFTKSIMLMTSPTVRKVLMGQEKLKLYLSKLVVEAVEIPLSADLNALLSFFADLFSSKLDGAR